jgi:uncharacterized membrane protein YraQ (UPF0718 family)
MPDAIDRGERARTRRVADALCLILALALTVRFFAPGVLSSPAVAAWSTVFVAICVQASPYLVLGIVVSTLIAVFVPPAFFSRVVPESALLAVPLAGVAGAALPGCECGSVPVAASLMRRGVARGPAVAFLLSAPAINPVVLVATAVAFPHHPIVVAARAAGSLLTALVVGWFWQRLGRTIAIPRRFAEHRGPRYARAREVAGHDLTQSLGYLAIGAAATATLNVTVPRSFLAHFAGTDAIAVPALAVLAVLLSVCSEADAFVAASLSQFSLTARLTFMVVGPAVDLKLIAMQAGTFGRRFVVRFAPLTAVTACVSALLVGRLLL